MDMSNPVYFSTEMVRALPEDGNRYETVYGELLVTPTPQPLHQLVVLRLLVLLEGYLLHEPVGELLPSPADISWGPDVLVQPDLFVARLEEVRTMDWSAVKTLLLVIEVMSPGTARADRFVKRRLYQKQQIPAYWIVDPDAKLVEVWTPEALFPTVVTDAVEWRPAGAVEPCVIRIEELFRPI